MVVKSDTKWHRLIIIEIMNEYGNINGSLSNVRIEFMPLNTTSKLQPCDQGIIRSMKAKYRCRPGMFMISLDKTKEVDLSNALEMLHASWTDVKEETIINSWKKSRIIGQATYVEDEERPVNAMNADDNNDYNDEIDAMEDAASLFHPRETDIDRLMEVETMMMNKGENEEPEKQEVSMKSSPLTSASNISSTITADSSLLAWTLQ